ncbi:MAG: SURF1 family protein [Candidatus Nanopelagicales bacterium]|nr:SURF1 family protein [Candidatus Nanopelagicales bacterium]
MLALLRTRRWIGFTTLVLVAIVAFGLLSNWQWHRAEEKQKQRLALETAAAKNPIDLTALSPTAPDWQIVSATGTYDFESQVVVRQRPQDGRNGFWVLTPLELTDGRSVWVARGWIPASASATTSPGIPDPPRGQILILGSWHGFEVVNEASREGLPRQMVGAVDQIVLPAAGDFTGYLRLTSSAPAQAVLSFVAAPKIDDTMNLSYAGQWLLFAGVALVGWFFFLRREAKDDTIAHREMAASANGS